MSTVNTLLEGASPYQVLQEQAGKLAGKWNRSGLLEGIESSTEKNNMSMLLENQAKQLVNEANNLATAGNGASFSAGNSEAWAGVALPLVRRVFGEIVAKDLVSVQPMNLPAGLIFYLDFQYGDDTGFKSADESLYGATSDMKRTDGAFNKGLYGAGEFAYSSTTSSLASGTGTHLGFSSSFAASTCTTGHTTASATLGGILNMDTEFSASHAGEFGGDHGATAIVRVISIHTGSFEEADSSVKIDREAIRAYKLTSDASGFTVFPQFTRFNHASSSIEFVVSSAHVASTEGGTALNLACTFYKLPENLNVDI